MPWFKVDDNFHSNKKVLRIPRNRRCAAVGLWILVGTWSASNLTDGKVPDYLPTELGGTQRMVDDLVAAGLWIPVADEHIFPNWDEYQPTKQKVEGKREADRQRQAEWRDKHREEQSGRLSSSEQPVTSMSQRDGDATDDLSQRDIPRVTPPPTRPDPTPKEEKNKRVRDTSRFEEFWEAYPAKKGKAAAQRNWSSLMRRGIDPQRIIDGAKAYAAEMRAKDDPKYKYPQGWLTDGRWEDEPEPVEAPTRQSLYSAPPVPDDMPRSLYVKWNRAHFEAHQAGRPGPADWHQLEEQAS